jgi:hypothetical protein
MKKDNYILGYNTELEKALRIDADIKIKTFNELFEYCAQFVHLKDIKLFEANAYDYFIQLFNDKYRNEFPSIVGLEKMLELSSVNCSKIKSLEQKYKSIDIHIDIDTMQPTISDCNIYATTQKQIDLHKIALELITALDKLKETGHHFWNGQICQASGNLITIDFANSSKFVPSLHMLQNNYSK